MATLVKEIVTDFRGFVNGDKKQKKNKPNAMIVLEKSKKRVIRYVKPQYIPSDSFEKEYKGNWLHILGLDLKGQFWTIGRPPTKAGRRPTDLYVALHCADEVNEVYGLSMPLSEKIKLGVFVGLIIAILIVIFLIAAGSGGGGL